MNLAPVALQPGRLLCRRCMTWVVSTDARIDTDTGATYCNPCAEIACDTSTTTQDASNASGHAGTRSERPDASGVILDAFPRIVRKC